MQPWLPDQAVDLQQIMNGPVVEQKSHIAHGQCAQRADQRCGAKLLRDAASRNEQQHKPVHTGRNRQRQYGMTYFPQKAKREDTRKLKQIIRKKIPLV